ncbi:AAA family ATPase, partial [Omnitrophica bacterium]|nr:AAA family ATPase [Candidatus Omnitrophota bacterium]
QNIDIKVRVTAALVLEELDVKFPQDVMGRPKRLPYWRTLNRILRIEGTDDEAAGDYLGVRDFFRGPGLTYLYSILPMACMLIFVPMPYWMTLSLYVLAAGPSYGLSYVVLRNCYGVIYRPRLRMINTRYKRIPLALDDFYKLFEPFEGKNIIQFPIMGKATTPPLSLKTYTGWAILIAAAIVGGAVSLCTAFFAYGSGLLMATPFSFTIFALLFTITGFLFACGAAGMLVLYAFALSGLLFMPFWYFLKSLRPTMGERSFKLTLPYSKEAIEMFRVYREDQREAARRSAGISGEKVGIQDIISTLRDDKVVVKDGEVIIDNIALPLRKKDAGNPFVPDVDEAKLIHTVSTVRNMKKVAISLLLDEPVLLVGESGVGKTSMVRYLASLANWGFRRFNLNGQTEKTELIGGYRPDEKGDFKWVDGIIIRAMREGDILVLDEINLAESQVLERINSLLDDDKYLSIPEKGGGKGGDTVWLNESKYRARVKRIMGQRSVGEEEAGRILEEEYNIFMIHPDFRLVATMNPVEYAGRNILSPALMNRFKVKWIEEPYRLEREAIFNEMFKDADGRPLVSWGTLDRVEWIYTMLRNMSMARKIGERERDPYYYSIRDLLKLGRRVRMKVDEIESAQGKRLSNAERKTMTLRELEPVFADRIRDEDDREAVCDVFRLQGVFGDFEVKARDDISVDTENARIGETVLKRWKGGGPYVPGPAARLFNTPTTNRYLARIAEMISPELNEKPLLVGPTGSAKTSLIRYLAYLTGNNFVRVNLDAYTDTSELIGAYIPIEDKEGEFKWRDGILVTALKEGYWVLLDELNLADPEILERINSLLDDEGSLVITEHESEKIVSASEYKRRIDEYIYEHGGDGEKGREGLKEEAEEALRRQGIHRVHPNFRLFAAMNPERYAGRNRISLAMRNRLSEIWISGEMEAGEYGQIVSGYLADNPKKDKMVGAMVALHAGIDEIADYLEGGTIDKYQFSMRDIKAWAEYVSRYGGRLGWTQAFAKGALYIYYDRMTTKGDKDKFMKLFEEVAKKSSYAEACRYAQNLLGRMVSQEDKRILAGRDGRTLRLLDIEIETNKSPESEELVPKEGVARLTHTDSAVKDLERIAQAADLDEPLLLIGETGAGKTSLVRYLAYLTNNGFQRFNLSGQTEKIDFIGGYRPEKSGRFVWRDGVLIEAMKSGQWLVVDEINLAPSQVIERLNSLLDDDGFLVVTEHRGEKYMKRREYDRLLAAYAGAIEKRSGCSRDESFQRARRLFDEKLLIYPIHPDFRIFATMNPSEYAGRETFSPALLNRFRVKWIDEPSRKDVKEILHAKYGSQLDRHMIDRAIEVHYKMIEENRKAENVNIHYTLRHPMRWLRRAELGTAEG